MGCKIKGSDKKTDVTIDFLLKDSLEMSCVHVVFPLFGSIILY